MRTPVYLWCLTGFISITLLLFLTVISSACSHQEPFRGTELLSRNVAAPFTLENQFGHQVTLADYTDNVIVLTFLYTSCPDICPIVTSHLWDVYEELGSDSQSVAFVAISVDPERDNVQQSHTYSERWKMSSRWDYLVGTREQLAPIWKAYYVEPISDHQLSHNRNPHTANSREHEISNSSVVEHSAPVYLIDGKGFVRVLFTLPFESEALTHDIRLLME